MSIENIEKQAKTTMSAINGWWLKVKVAMKAKLDRLSPSTQDFIRSVGSVWSTIGDREPRLVLEFVRQVLIHRDDEHGPLQVFQRLKMQADAVAFCEKNKAGAAEIVKQWPEIGEFLR